MTRIATVLALVLALVTLFGRVSATTDFAKYVDPFIGTAPSPAASYGREFDAGDVFPGAAYPSGMLYWSPDTAETRIPGGYYYLDHTIKGFSLTHFSGRGCTVYQDVPIMPLLGDTPEAASFSHANETAEPGYYAITLDNGIQFQLTVTPRSGFGSVRFPEGTPRGVISIDAGGSVNGVFDSQISIDVDHQLVSGYVVSQVGCGTDRYTMYFAIAFDRPIDVYTSSQSGALVAFDTSTNPRVRLKPAISYVSIENALSNLAAENNGWDFEAVRAGARTAWNQALGKIEVSGGSDADLRVFYTALYHTFFHPNLFSDVNGEYMGFDDRIHQVAADHAHYHDIPGWDQYRSLIQLRSILTPDQASDVIQSLVDDAEQGGGGMPRWEQANRNSAGMVGDSPGVYVANAYAFGARDFDQQTALAALDFGASTPGAPSGGHAVREYLEPWLNLGYVPDQPSISLEYATDDFGIAQLAAALGDGTLAEKYARRAAGWVNTFNPTTGYVEPRDASGAFDSQEHGRACCGFVEGNAAQYTWMVPFDYAGLFARLGGSTAAVSRLDDFFSEVNAGPNRPYGWIGNEPSLNSPWAYDFAGAPARTQATVRRIQRELFTATPGGLPGNDDGGTTSAWYLFSALGFYPAVPGVGGVALGSPLFSDAIVHLADGSAIHVRGNGAAVDAPYVQAVALDSVSYNSTWIDWSRLSDGATLEFTLASTG